MDELVNGIEDAFVGAVSAIVAFLPNLIAAIVLLIVGWIVGKFIGSVVTKILQRVGFNQVAERAEIDTFLDKAGVHTGPAGVVGSIVRWMIYLVFFLAAFAALDLPQVSALITSVIAYLPKVVLAVVVLFVGALVGKLMAGVVRGSVGSMGLGNSDLYANVARFAVIAFAVIMALDILDIAPTMVGALWTAFLAVIAGTIILAFGLGGRQGAAHLLLGRMLRSELEPGVEVNAGTVSGKVVSIGTLYTTINTSEGIVKVPNAEMTDRHVRIDQGQYDWQVQKRREMKEQAAATAHNGGRSRDPSGRNISP